MGCGASNSINDDIKKQNIIAVKRTIDGLRSRNSFFIGDFTHSDITTMITNIFKGQKTTNVEENINILLNQLRDKLKLNVHLFPIFKDVLMFACKKLKYVYPKKSFEIDVLLSLYFFFNENHQKITPDKTRFFRDLIIHSTTDIENIVETQKNFKIDMQ
ncbi:MAG: hypothetical protein MJ252_04605, partial [archaeon]|nr:hypothetical protein [archaeon]